MNSLDRDAESLSRLFHAQPAEKAQLHHPALARIDLRERVERLIERQQTFVALFADHHRLIERNLQRGAAPLTTAMLAREVYQYLTHQTRSRRKEMPAVFQPYPIGVDQPQVSFVNERGGLHGLPGSFTAHITLRQPPQLGVYQRHQLIERSLIAFAPGQEQLGDFMWIRLRHNGSKSIDHRPSRIAD